MPKFRMENLGNSSVVPHILNTKAIDNALSESNLSNVLEPQMSLAERGKALQCLQPGQCLNDIVINYELQ
jgi:hypothetical protein